MIIYSNLTENDIQTIISFGINETIHVHINDITELEIRDINSDQHLFPFSIDPQPSHHDESAYYEKQNAVMSKLSKIIYRFYVSGAKLALAKISKDHYCIYVLYSNQSDFKKIKQSQAFWDKLNTINKPAILNQLSNYLDKHSLDDYTEKHLINMRILLKYLEIYLSNPQNRPPWKRTRIESNASLTEIDIQGNQILITHQNVDYIAHIDNVLKFDNPNIPQAVMDFFDKYIIDVVGGACKNLYNGSAQDVTTIFC